MKCRKPSLRRKAINFFIVLSVVLISCKGDAKPLEDDFQKAIKHGADARFSLIIVNERNQPVQGAEISARFDSALQARGDEQHQFSDTNGVARFWGKTGKAVKIHISKNGYYASHDEICYVAMGCGVKGNRWLPDHLEKTIVLRTVKKPVALRHKIRGFKRTKKTDQWLKFDAEYGDFVAPNGKGVAEDFEVCFKWDGKLGKDYSGMSVLIRFNDPYSGGYYAQKILCSDFKDAYAFVDNIPLAREFTFFAKEERNALTHKVIRRTEQLFDTRKTLVARSRCEVDPQTGKLLRCNYFQIENIQFGCHRDGVVFLVKSIFNPTPNDTNLEPKR